MVSENGSEAEGTQESDNDTENDSEETESNSHETSTTFHLKNPCEHCENSNVYGTLIMKCPNCSWHDSFHQILEDRNNMKEGFLRCHDCGAVTHKNAKTLETTFYSRSKQSRIVQNIPKFKDRANWSRDSFQPMRRRACVYQQTNQNIAPVIKNFQNSGRSRTESVIVSRLSGIFLRLFMMRHTIFLSGQRIGSHIGSVS